MDRVLSDPDEQALLTGRLVEDQRVTGREDEVISDDLTAHGGAGIAGDAERLRVLGASLSDRDAVEVERLNAVVTANQSCHCNPFSAKSRLAVALLVLGAHRVTQV